MDLTDNQAEALKTIEKWGNKTCIANLSTSHCIHPITAKSLQQKGLIEIQSTGYGRRKQKTPYLTDEGKKVVDEL